MTPRPPDESSDPSARTPDAGPLDREQVVERLCDHYAADHLAMEEFERRVTAVHRVATRGDLRALLADLPPLTGEEAGGTGDRGSLASGAPRSDSASPGEGAGLVPARVSDAQVRNSRTELAIWSGRSRKGPWIPARTTRVVAIMGGIELDFREARFPEGEVRVHVLAIMGGVDIMVPPGVRVETDGLALMGGFDEVLDPDQGGFDDDAPVLRITGVAFLGGVDIHSRHPGESAREARRRRKRLEKDRREARDRLGPGEER